MSNYPEASIFERAAYGTLAAAMGVGLLSIVVTAFHTSLVKDAVVEQVACERPVAMSDVQSTVAIATR